MYKIALTLSLVVFAAQSSLADTRVCKTTKFGLNDSDEICAEIAPVEHGKMAGSSTTRLKVVTDVSTYDPTVSVGSRQAIGEALCKLFGYSDHFFASMTFRTAENAGFIGGGAILGGGFKKIPVINTIRCR